MKIIIKNPNPSRDIRVNLQVLPGTTIDLLKSIGAVHDDESGLSFCLGAYTASALTDFVESTSPFRIKGDWLLEIDGLLQPREFDLVSLKKQLANYDIDMEMSSVDESSFTEVTLKALSTITHNVRLHLTSTSAIDDTSVDDTISVGVGYVDICLGLIPKVSRCYNFDSDAIAQLTNTENMLKTSYIARYPVSLNHFSVNGLTVSGTSDYGGLELADNPYVRSEDWDGFPAFIALGTEPVYVMACSSEPIPLEFSPFWGTASVEQESSHIWHRDEEGYETVIFALNTPAQ